MDKVTQVYEKIILVISNINNRDQYWSLFLIDITKLLQLRPQLQL